MRATLLAGSKLDLVRDFSEASQTSIFVCIRLSTLPVQHSYDNQSGLVDQERITLYDSLKEHHPYSVPCNADKQSLLNLGRSLTFKIGLKTETRRIIVDGNRR